MEKLYDSLFEITPKANSQLSKIAVKLIFIINCTLLTFWATTRLGYPIIVEEFNSKFFIGLFSQYKLVVPLFSFLFINLSIGLIGQMVISFFSHKIFIPIILRIKYNIHFSKSRNRTLDAQRETLKSRIKRLENDSKAENKSKSEQLEESYYYEYLLRLSISIFFIYQIIVKETFKNLYYTAIVGVIFGIIFWIVLVLSALMFLSKEKSFLEDYLKERKRRFEKKYLESIAF